MAPDRTLPDDDLLASAVQRLEQGGQPAVDELLAQHPEHAAAIREQLGVLARFGMLERPQGKNVPERLGEFVLKERLGSGGMGVVYLAEQPSLRRDVAVKLIRPESLYFPNARERFRREVEAIAGLQHPSIVRVFSANVDGDLPYFTMERVEGVSLDQLLEHVHERGNGAPARLTEADVRDTLIALGGGERVAPAGARPRGWVEVSCQWVHELADAIEYAHRHGVLHRDVKPSNVMITWSMRAMLLDFGLASTQGDGKLTRTGAQLGSIPYMAPEQLRGENDLVGPRTDIYALGVLLYELLTLRNPFHEGSTSADETRRRIIAAQAPPVRHRNASVSWDAETVCQCAMAPEQGRRYPSARALADDLQNLLSLRPIAARRPHAALRLRRWVGRHQALAAASAMGVLLAIAAPAAFAVSEYRLRHEITSAKDRAENEASTRADILAFFTDELLAAVSPDEVGKDATMREVLDLAASKIEDRFADRPLVEAEIRSTLGHTYRKLGVLDVAEGHLERAIALFTQALGPTDRKTLDAERRLGSVWSARGHYRENADLLRRNWQACREVFGDDDEDTLAAANNLGLALTRIGQHEEAIDILGDVVERRLVALGEQHEHTQASMSNLGMCYYNLGRYAEAEPWMRRELEACVRANGDDDPGTWISRHNFANLLGMLGRDAEGIEQMDLVIAAQRRIYGPGHTETLSSLAGKARMLGRIGRCEEALAVTADIERNATALPADGDLMLAVRTGKCSDLIQLGRLAEARAEAERLIRDCEHKQGPTSHRTLVAKATLAKALMRDGDREQAARLLGDVIDAWTEAPTEMLARLKTQHGVNLRTLERWTEAEAELQGAWRIVDGSGGRSPLVGMLFDEFVRLYEQCGRDADAAVWRGRREARAAGQ